jgi:hypothetical protein
MAGVIELDVAPGGKLVFQPVERVEPRTFSSSNPFTGESLEFRTATRMAARGKSLKNPRDIVAAAAGVPEFDMRLSGKGMPRTPPLPIDFAKAYSVDVGCCVRANAVSLSDLHEESGSDKNPVMFGEDCNKEDLVGLYSHPETLEIIEVPGAGCAQFWIEFDLGKFLFPKIDNGNLRILNARIEQLAKRCFASEFVQGCCWG